MGYINRLAHVCAGEADLLLLFFFFFGFLLSIYFTCLYLCREQSNNGSRQETWVECVWNVGGWVSAMFSLLSLFPICSYIVFLSLPCAPHLDWAIQQDRLSGRVDCMVDHSTEDRVSGGINGVD
jgi:hypothetical protein